MAAPETFSEDEAIRDQLEDPVDLEAFSNLMAHAHQLGRSAVAMVQEQPSFTSRPAIRKLCVGRHKAKSAWLQLRNLLRRIGKPNTSPPSDDPVRCCR